MNIKSLLLGSAAALLAVSGARAADAVVVAEPEPMEYVRICDVYGAGFYYIPGTETCLAITGMVRYDALFSSYSDDTALALGRLDLADGDDWDDAIPVRALNDGWAKQMTARVRFDARSETEFGTFRRYIELSSTSTGNVEGVFAVRNAYIELGGLLVGHTDTLWDGDLAPEFDSGGGSRVDQIRYSFDAGNGLALAVSVEEPTYNDNYAPNAVGRVSFSQGWGSLTGYLAYDSGRDVPDVDGSWAAKGIANFKATDAISLGLMATYSSDPNFFTPEGFWGGSKWSVAGSVSWAINDKLTLAGGAQWFGDFVLRLDDDGFPDDDEGTQNNWAIGANLDYQVVDNLLARASIKYEDGDTFFDGGATSGYLRLEGGF